MRFIDEQGVLLSTSSSTYTPTVQNLWERAIFTWPVPEGATRAELRMEGVISVILMAQPKVANGTDPGSYGSNWSPQLTFLTPTGIYTGTLSAKQIILSAGEDLSDRLVTINANQILMSSKLDNRTTKITNEGVYTGEIVADQVKTGLLKSTNGASEINMDNGSFSFGNGALAWNGALLQVTGKFSSRLSSTKPTRVEIENGRIKLTNALGNTVGQIDNWNANTIEGLNISAGVNSKYLSFGHIVSGGGLLVDYYINLGENPGGATERHIFSYDARIRGKLVMEGPIDVATIDVTMIRDAASRNRISVAPAGDFVVYDNAGNLVIWISKSGNFAQLHLPSSIDNAIGVDATGAYKIKSGTKTYL